MNCKPGDLAVVVQCPLAPGAIGRIVECLLFRGPANIDGHRCTDVWEVRWGDNSARLIHGTQGWAVPDAWLRPISNPGDDARDETLDWLPVPTKEHA